MVKSLDRKLAAINGEKPTVAKVLLQKYHLRIRCSQLFLTTNSTELSDLSLGVFTEYGYQRPQNNADQFHHY